MSGIDGQWYHSMNKMHWSIHFCSAIGMPLERHTQGYMTWNVGLSSAMTTMIVRNTDKSYTGAVFSLGVSSSFVSMNHTWKINKEDLKLRIYCKSVLQENEKYRKYLYISLMSTSPVLF